LKKHLANLRNTQNLGRALFAALLLALTTPSFARLGEPETLIKAEATQLGASLLEERTATHKIVTLDTPAELRIRQWVNAQGRVFAITWAGPVMPDLAQLLGRHYTAFREAAERGHSTRSAVRLDTPEVVIESAGRMRAFRGRAFCPPMLPAGVRPEDIR